MREGIDSTYVSASVSVIRPEYLAFIDFAPSASVTQSVRLWSGLENRIFSDCSSVGSGSYIGVGTLGAISAVSETSEVAAKSLELTLSGIPTEYLYLAFNNSYRGRTVAVYLLLYNESKSSYQQTMIFRGRADQMIINEGGDTSNIVMKCESRLVDLNRAREKRYTDEYQKSIYPNDTGLEFMAGMTKDIYWGLTAPVSTIATNGGGDGETIMNQP